jgi:hypothetical protein
MEWMPMYRLDGKELEDNGKEERLHNKAGAARRPPKAR